jgi:hypothetical protein
MACLLLLPWPAVGGLPAVDDMPDVMLTCVLVAITVPAFVIVPALLAFLPMLPSRLLLACLLSMASCLSREPCRYTDALVNQPITRPLHILYIICGLKTIAVRSCRFRIVDKLCGLTNIVQ